jgi:hypothetical protein
MPMLKNLQTFSTMATKKTDDEKYWALMSKYKEERLTKDEEATKWLKAAMKLSKEGNVSDDAILGGGYM